MVGRGPTRIQTAMLGGPPRKPPKNNAYRGGGGDWGGGRGGNGGNGNRGGFDSDNFGGKVIMLAYTQAELRKYRLTKETLHRVSKPITIHKNLRAPPAIFSKRNDFL